MRRTTVSLILGIVLCAAALANDIERVHAIYEYISDNPNETPAQVKAKAFERARMQALEDKFGLDVSSICNTMQLNSSGEGTAVAQTNVFSLGGTSVRGEWIETIKEEVLEPAVFKDGFWRIKVKVEGRARNHATEKTDISFAFVRDIQDVEAPVTFRDGNDLFLRFSTPADGWLCVYLVDESLNAFCLLPYENNPYGAQAVESNRDYVFFSEKHDTQAQEYTLNCRNNSEQNALYVIFSPSVFSKANDRKSGANWRDEAMPRQLPYADFLKWLADNQKKDASMVVRTSVVSIRK